MPLAFAALAGDGVFSPGLGPGFAADVFFFGALFDFGAAAVSSATRAGDGCAFAADGFAFSPGLGPGFADVVIFVASVGFADFVVFAAFVDFSAFSGCSVFCCAA